MKKLILLSVLVSTTTMAEDKKPFNVHKISNKVGIAGYYLGDVLLPQKSPRNYTAYDDRIVLNVSDHSFKGYSGLAIETTPNSHLIYSIKLEKDRVVCSDEAKRTADILSSNLKRSYTTSLDGTWDTYKFNIKDKRVFVSCFAYGYNNKIYFFDDKLIDKSIQEGKDNVKNRDDYWNRVTNIKK